MFVPHPIEGCEMRKERKIEREGKNKTWVKKKEERNKGG